MSGLLPIAEFPAYGAHADGYIVNLRTGRRVREYAVGGGYRMVFLRHEGVGYGPSYGRLVHRLILTAHVGPCPPGMESLHEDDNGSHNALSNLRWGTRLENRRMRQPSKPAQPARRRNFRAPFVRR